MSPRSLRNQAKAALDAIEKEPGTTAAHTAYRKMMLTCSRERMSRRVFLERTTQVQDKKTGVWGQWLYNAPQRALECIRLKTVREGRLERYLILKARKWGVSTLGLGWALDAAEREPGMQCAIIAQHKDAAAALLHQGKQMRDRQHFQLVHKFDNRNQLYFAPPIDSAIDIASAESDDPLRSRTMRHVHCTEPQIWKDVANKRASIENAVAQSKGTFIAYEGTGYGRNWWYDAWFEARRGEGLYKAIFLPWLMDRDFDYSSYCNPEQVEQLISTITFAEEQLRQRGATWGQILWRREKIGSTYGGDEKLFSTDFPATPEEAFLAEGRPAFSAVQIDKQAGKCTDPVFVGDVAIGAFRDGSGFGVEYRLVEDRHGTLEIWAQPVYGHEYSIGADASEGKDQDASAAYVIDNHTGKMVAKYRSNKVIMRDFGLILSALGQHYNTAYVLPEVNKGGAGVIDALKEVSYRRIGTRSVYDQRGKVVGQKLGWATSAQSRPRLFEEIRWNLAGQGEATNADRGLYAEMIAMYRDEEGKESTPIGKTDDLVVAWGITLMARRDSISPQSATLEHALAPGSLEERHWNQYEASVAPKEEELSEW